jgi:hypothetical protein
VNAGQAGDEAGCASCGRVIQVPKLRDLGSFRVAESTSEAHRDRNVSSTNYRLAAVGAAVLLVASFLVMPAVPDISADMHREVMARMTDAEIHSLWTDVLAKNNVRRPPTSEELTLQRRHRKAAVMSLALQLVAASLVVTTVALLVVSWARDRGANPGR